MIIGDRKKEELLTKGNEIIFKGAEASFKGKFFDLLYHFNLGLSLILEIDTSANVALAEKPKYGHLKKEEISMLSFEAVLKQI